jgi:hypothetical protein
MALGEDYSSSDDDDVDRYVFLARQPQPPRSHAEEEASDEDDEDDETKDERVEEDGGRRGMKRPLREVVSSDASPSPKRARLGMIIAPPPLASHKTQTSSSTEDDQMVSFSPRGGVRDRESSGSDETREDERSDPRRGKAKNTTTKLVVGLCGKRERNSPGCEEVDQEQRRDVTKAAKTSPPSAGRFPCSLCDRCFASYQALGGHVLGHQKKARIAATAAAAASLHDAGGRGNCREEIVVAAEVELDHDDANGTGHVKQKTSIHDVDDAACREDVDRDGHMKLKPKKKKPSVVAEEHHMGAHGNGETDMRASVFTASVEGVNDHDGNREKASSRSSRNGREETAIGATGHNDAGVKNKKATAAGSPRKDAANGTSNVADACRAQHYKCKVCCIECPTGRALGGHMRKHRKQPAQGADGDGRPAADGDSMIPLSRQFGVTGSQRALGIAGETSR